MSLRQNYGSEALDTLFCFFMKTILRIEKHGAHKIPVDVSFYEPVQTYLKTAMALLENAQPPAIVALVLQAEYDQILQNFKPTKAQVIMLLLIGAFTRNLQADTHPAHYTLSTSNLWNTVANEYATKAFYGNLPLEIQQQYGLDAVLQQCPKDFLAPEEV